MRRRSDPPATDGEPRYVVAEPPRRPGGGVVLPYRPSRGKPHPAGNGMRLLDAVLYGGYVTDRRS